MVGGGGSLPYPGRPPAGVMGVRGKRGSFPQGGSRWTTLRDRDSPLRYKGRSLPEMAKAQGSNDLAVTLGLLLQKHDVAAASWPPVWPQF